MALDWFEGWGSYADTSALEKVWTETHGAVALSQTLGPDGRPCLIIPKEDVGPANYVVRTRTETDYAGVGAWVYFDSTDRNVTETYMHGRVITLMSDSHQDQVYLCWNTTVQDSDIDEGAYVSLGRITDDDYYYNGSTDTNRLQYDTWYFIELLVYIHDTLGEVTLKVNGETWVSPSDMLNVDTNASGNGVAEIQLGDDITASREPPNMRFGDLYMIETSGGVNSELLGPCYVARLAPTADGSDTDFTPITGSDHYAMVDDADPGHDYDSTSSLSDGTVGHKDTFTASGTLATNKIDIFGIEVRADIYDDLAAAKTARVTADTSNGAAASIDDTEYTTILDVFDENPATSERWTQTEAEAVEFGVEIVT